LIGLTCVALPAILTYGFATSAEQQVIAILSALIAVVVLLVQPFWGLMFFLTLMFTRPEDLFPAIRGMRLILWLALLTMAGAWFQLFVNRQRLSRHPMLIMMVGFTAMGVLGGALTGNLEKGITDFGRLFIFVALAMNLVRNPD